MQRGRNASQLNIAGTGIGSFNDRFRDAVLGGGPFGASQAQGIVTGLALQPNKYMQVRGAHTPAQVWSVNGLCQ